MKTTEKQYIGYFYIAYFDILGYKAKLEEYGTERLAQLIKKHIEIAKTISEYSKSNTNIDNEIKMKVFSDNMFFCSKKNWYSLIALSAALQNSMINDGIFIRGVLCHENLYFDEDFICGEGIVLAHEIESGYAVSPRILLHDSFTNAVNQEDRMVSVKNAFELSGAGIQPVTDTDGWRYIDYLAFSCSLVTDEKKIYDILSNHKMEIITNLENSVQHKSVHGKFLWCKGYHNAFIDNQIESANEYGKGECISVLEKLKIQEF